LFNKFIAAKNGAILGRNRMAPFYGMCLLGIRCEWRTVTSWRNIHDCLFWTLKPAMTDTLCIGGLLHSKAAECPQEVTLNNHNCKFLSSVFNAQINVEYCHSVKSRKYVPKCIHKGVTKPHLGYTIPSIMTKWGTIT